MNPEFRSPIRRGLCFGSKARRGFTLIELLIVIAIIAILAAMIIPVTGAVNRAKIKSKAHAELEHVATAIELYKAKLGHYPPDNPGYPALNQLYFELVGTTFTNWHLRHTRRRGEYYDRRFVYRVWPRGRRVH